MLWQPLENFVDKRSTTTTLKTSVTALGIDIFSVRMGYAHQEGAKIPRFSSFFCFALEVCWVWLYLALSKVIPLSISHRTMEHSNFAVSTQDTRLFRSYTSLIWMGSQQILYLSQASVSNIALHVRLQLWHFSRQHLLMMHLLFSGRWMCQKLTNLKMLGIFVSQTFNTMPHLLRLLTSRNKLLEPLVIHLESMLQIFTCHQMPYILAWR